MGMVDVARGGHVSVKPTKRQRSNKQVFHSGSSHIQLSTSSSNHRLTALLTVMGPFSDAWRASHCALMPPNSRKKWDISRL
jgi:hypothetical protein